MSGGQVEAPPLCVPARSSRSHTAESNCARRKKVSGNSPPGSSPEASDFQPAGGGEIPDERLHVRLVRVAVGDHQQPVGVVESPVLHVEGGQPAVQSGGNAPRAGPRAMRRSSEEMARCRYPISRSVCAARPEGSSLEQAFGIEHVSTPRPPRRADPPARATRHAPWRIPRCAETAGIAVRPIGSAHSCRAVRPAAASPGRSTAFVQANSDARRPPPRNRATPPTAWSSIVELRQEPVARFDLALAVVPFASQFTFQPRRRAPLFSARLERSSKNCSRWPGAASANRSRRRISRTKSSIGTSWRAVHRS